MLDLLKSMVRSLIDAVCMPEPNHMTPAEAADLLERFLREDVGWEMTHFLDERGFTDLLVDEARAQTFDILLHHPSVHRDRAGRQYHNSEGERLIFEVAHRLRAEKEQL